MAIWSSAENDAMREKELVEGGRKKKDRSLSHPLAPQSGRTPACHQGAALCQRNIDGFTFLKMQSHFTALSVSNVASVNVREPHTAVSFKHPLGSLSITHTGM